MTEKEKRIERERKRLLSLFGGADHKQLKLAEPLIQNTAFMKITLEDLQQIINVEGVVDVYQNGANQSGTKQSATLQSYNALVKNYAGVQKQLSQLLGEIAPEADKADDQLLAFVRAHA